MRKEERNKHKLRKSSVSTLKIIACGKNKKIQSNRQINKTENELDIEII